MEEKKYWEENPTSVLVKAYKVNGSKMAIEIVYPTVIERIMDECKINLCDANGEPYEPMKFNQANVGKAIENMMKEFNKE